MEKGLKSCGWENIKILKLLDALFPDFFVKIGKMMNNQKIKILDPKICHFVPFH